MKLEDGCYQVKFTKEALESFREAWPELPPGDEIIVKMRRGKCGKCGEDIPVNKIAGFDLVGITDDGEVVGEHVCGECMEKGL